MTSSNWEDYKYVLPMDTTLNSPAYEEKLRYLQPFLKQPEDVCLVGSIIDYDVPHNFAIITKDSNPFLCINTFPDELLAQSTELAEYGRFFTECPPHIVAAMFKGATTPLAGPEIEVSDMAEAVKMALATNDIFVVQIQTGKTGVDDLYSALVSELLGHETPKPETFDEYKSRIQQKPDYSATNRLEEIRADLAEYAATYPSAMSALQEAYFLSLAKSDKEALTALNNAMSISVNSKSSPSSVKRLRRSIYSLPLNSITYEDNGDIRIKETIRRLEGFCEDGPKALKKLADTYDASGEWFAKMANLKKELLIAAYTSEGLVISQEHKEKVLSALDLNIQALKKAAEADINPILLEYFAKITPKNMNKYLTPYDSTFPFSHKGTVIVDTDACGDKDIIVEETQNARRLILLGNCNNDLFKLFLQGAGDRGIIYEAR